MSASGNETTSDIPRVGHRPRSATQFPSFERRQLAIEGLQKVTEDLGRVPKSHEWKVVRGEYPSLWEITHHLFSSWSAAVEAADLETTTEEVKKQTIVGLQAVADDLGHTPSLAEWKRHRGSYPSEHAIRLHYGSWSDALTTAGLKPRTAQERQFSPDEVVSALNQMAAELGHAPTQGEWDEKRGPHPGSRSVADYFGSWEAARRAAGVTRQRGMTRETMLNLVRQNIDRLGRVPTRREWIEDPLSDPSVYALQSEFGSWPRALREAGFVARREYKPSREELVEEMLAHVSSTGNFPTQKEWRASTETSFSIYAFERAFGSWKAALAAANDEWSARAADRRKWTDEEMLAELRSFAADGGGAPTVKRWKGRVQPAPDVGTYIQRFGSWRNALRKAGVKSGRQRARTNARGRIRRAFERDFERLERAPTRKEWGEADDGRPSAAVVVKIYGNSWQGVVERMGYEPPVVVSPPMWTRDLVIRKLQQTAKRRKKIPLASDWRKAKRGNPSSATVRKLFGSWAEALEAADLVEPETD